MAYRVAEHSVRTRPFGPKVRFRVDLHGVLRLGPGEERSLIRWEWIEDIAVDDEGRVCVRSPSAEVRFPPGSFGLTGEALADRLQTARAIDRRPEVIGELNAGPAAR